MAYNKTIWIEGGPPGITAANLNKLETQYDEALAWIISKGIGGNMTPLGDFNFNNISESGIYFIGPNAINPPSAGHQYYIVFHMQLDANNKTQLAIEMGTNVMYLRTKYITNPWTTWAAQEGIHSIGWNANGQWVRYTNSIQECWRRGNAPANQFAWQQTVMGSDHYFWRNEIWVFPAAFKAGTEITLLASGDIPVAYPEHHYAFYVDNIQCTIESGSHGGNPSNSTAPFHRTHYAKGFWK